MSSAGSYWFKCLDGSESGVTRYWLHKRLREIYGWRAYRMCRRDGVIYKVPGKYPLGEWGANG